MEGIEIKTEEERPLYKAKFYIKKELGEYSEVFREVMKEMLFTNTPDAYYEVTVTERQERNYTATRYKYYFDCVMYLALLFRNDRFFFIDESTGEQTRPRTTEEMHECYKLEFNSVLVMSKVTGNVYKTAKSTRKLSDRDFIGKYTDEILLDIFESGKVEDIPTYEEWKEMHKTNQWKSFKVAIEQRKKENQT